MPEFIEQLSAAQERLDATTKSSDERHTCLCREVPTDHEAQSQAEARRSDDSCERDVSTHGSATTSSFGGMRAQMPRQELPGKPRCAHDARRRPMQDRSRAVATAFVTCAKLQRKTRCRRRASSAQCRRADTHSTRIGCTVWEMKTRGSARQQRRP